jgi:hypothetical protein
MDYAVNQNHPSWRKPAGIFAILGIIAIWCFIIASYVQAISRMPFAIQIAFYAIAGIIWIAPMKPLLKWMETGKWRE